MSRIAFSIARFFGEQVCDSNNGQGVSVGDLIAAIAISAVVKLLSDELFLSLLM